MTWATREIAGWGRVLRAEAALARPERQRTARALAESAPAPALGRRRSYGDACLAERAMLTERLDRVLSFDPETGTLEAESGVMLGDLAARLAPLGWLPPVMPGTGFATMGGAIAMDVHGKNHHHAGAFAAHVDRLTLATPAGPVEVAPGDPLFALTAGGLGQTGPILKATIRLARVRGDVMMVTERRMADLDAFCDALDASDAPYTVGWIDATATGPALGRGILEEGEVARGLVPPAKRGRTVPLDAPGFALSAPVVRTFNAAYLRRVPARGRTVVRPIADYFFPLDRIHDWNRLYGKCGFHQFQCVVPMDARPALRDMLARIGKAALASPLAVLKRLGPGAGHPMSFPVEGYTLAIDLPARDGADRLLAALNAATAEAGGRVYLAKDSSLTAEQAHAMYPGRAAWAEAVNARDPERAYETALVKRLRLREAA
ncbi:FAD-binding oxidoreductase [Rhodovulum sp. 12E13]|uniref:FAD-binding protein n=1 Tax=Rhodovulum sp. 12E13 TaxID=2203891 RepID=UPI000E15E411|nr:FAD-binding protein [Rhodovulum sp. 12E13]RDC71451.1 FAD-binding oxidoreductase [Rhodovulum sp. 12E13]